MRNVLNSADQDVPHRLLAFSVMRPAFSGQLFNE